jgi:hypothetical protein
MNSLPFISHHLFVAAIGNEGRANERPTRHERLSVGVADAANAVALEVLDGRRQLPVGDVHSLRVSVAQAQS